MTVSVSLTSLINEAEQVAACASGILSNDSSAVAEPECSALTGEMWQFVEKTLMTCTTTSLGNVGQELVNELQSDLEQQEEANVAVFTAAVVALAVPPAAPVIEPILGAVDLTLDVTGAISDTALAFGEAQVDSYEANGYSTGDQFQMCSVNRSIPGADLLVDDLLTLHPVGTAEATPQPPPAPGQISGTVIDATTGQAVQGAQVLLYGGCAQTTPINPAITASDGTYSFADVSSNAQCNLSVTKLGYVERGELNISLTSGPTTTLNFSLVHAGFYVTNAPAGGPYSITEYAITANNDAKPIARITSSSLSIPSAIAVDAQGNVWVANCGSACGGSGNGTVTEIAAGSTGTQSPILTLAGPNTQLQGPVGLAFDAIGNLYVANVGGSVTEYALAEQSGNVDAAPAASIGGSNTGLTFPQGVPAGIGLDGAANIYVTNGAANSVEKFAPLTGLFGNQNVSPIETIVGSSTGIINPAGVTVDGNGNIWIANQGQPNGPNPIPGSITEYTGSALSSGTNNAAPFATITGSNTQLSNPYGVFLYSNGNVYVTNAFANIVTVYTPPGPGMNNVSPIAAITGPDTQLNSPGGTGAIYPSMVAGQ